MYRRSLRLFSVTVLAAYVFMPSSGFAQQYTGDFSVTPKKQEQEDLSSPVPKIFSSNASNVQAAEQLDVMYDSLLVSLWNHAQTDFVHQKSLEDLMKNERFRTSRYAKEFTPAMDKALSNLNDNYKSMMDSIQDAEDRYDFIAKDFKMIDKSKVVPIWEEKIAELKSDAKTYFKMQHQYLNAYRNLVGFVLKQGGSYYYKAETRRVHFYNFQHYKFFGKSIDKLKMINYKQRQFLRKRAPANIDLATLQ